MHTNPHTTLITSTAPVTTATHGGRAKCLQRLVRLDLPVPLTVALSFEAVHKIAAGELPDIDAIRRGALERPASGEGLADAFDLDAL